MGMTLTLSMIVNVCLLWLFYDISKDNAELRKLTHRAVMDALKWHGKYLMLKEEKK